MKKIFFVVMLFIANGLQAQEHKLVKLWETHADIAIPESVLPANKKTMYVSLIDGAPWEADGKGGVGVMNAAGKNYNGTWITGLHAPKGMGLKGKWLYVADLSELVVINKKKAVIHERIAIPGATGLNDVTVTDKGIVYVSDSKSGKVWRVENGQPVLFLDSLTGVNGLKAVGDDLIIAAGKSFISVSAQKQKTKIAELPMSGDGIEPIGNGDYLVTTWAGQVYYVYANGKVDILLDTMAEKKNTADIGYDAKKRILYVPTFNARTVVAYRLE
ncbi:MAG: ATP-binding protein [Flavisolibacter sp.]